MLSCMSTPHSQELEWRTKFHKPRIDKELQPTLRPKHKALTNGHRIARHLPVPFINGAGEATVPKLTEFVLSRFEDDRLTFSEFCAGTHSFQMYVGDMGQQRENEAAAARPFFNHPLKRIREWARHEYDSGVQDAKLEREREDEMNP